MEERRPNLTPKEFFEYVSVPVSQDLIDLTYKVHNIIPEKTDLYYELVISLFDIVFDTYLGKEIINTEKKMIEHFKWCWDKNLENFRRENIHIKNSEELYDYFEQFAIESFYQEKSKQLDSTQTKIKWFWGKCFEYEGIRTRSELDILVEVYKIFEKSLV